MNQAAFYWQLREATMRRNLAPTRLLTRVRGDNQKGRRLHP